LLTQTSKTALASDEPSSAGGKTAVSMLRRINTRGERGPWSEVCMLTVAA